jgi:hypothetical protein
MDEVILWAGHEALMDIDGNILLIDGDSRGI